MRHKVVLLLAGLILLWVLFLPAAPVSAADFRSGQTVVIEADEVIEDDLFVAAEIIEINGEIIGDLFAAGRVIVLNGTVDGSAVLTGQEIDVPGRVNGSLYSYGYALTLGEEAVVGRNIYFRGYAIYFCGYAIATHEGSQVGHDVFAGAAQFLHNGAAGGELNVDLNALEINGQVTGDVVGQVSARDTSTWTRFIPMLGIVDNNSPLLSTITRFSPPDVDAVFPGMVVGSAAQIGGQNLVMETTDLSLIFPGWLSDRIGEFIGLLIVAAVLIRATPAFLPGISGVLQGNPGASLGWGLIIYLLAFPLAIIVGSILTLLLTIIVALFSFDQFDFLAFGLAGSFLLFALFAFLVVAYILTWIFVGHRLGVRVLAREGVSETGRMAQFRYVALGVLLLQILHAIPVIGFILALLVGAWGLGALFVYWRNRRQPQKAVQPLPQPTASD
jgi:hypothetical protein